MSANEGNRLLSLVLVGTGILGLCASIYISARFGWSLADAQIDRAATATILGIADFASAMLIIAGARMRVWGWYGRSYAAIGVAGAFLAMGFLSAYGFFSNRISVHAAKTASVAVDREQLKWLQRQTVNTELPRAERRAMLAEVKAANAQLKSTIGIVSDQQAAAIGAWLGWSVEQTQTRLTAATAATAYAIKFSCLWFGVMLWPRRRVDRGSVGNSSGGDGKVVPLHKTEPSTAAKHAEPLPAASAATTQRSGLPVAASAPVQQRWAADDVDAYLTEVANSPNRPSWRAMGAAVGWEHTALWKRWQRSTGVNKGHRRPVLGGHRIQHRYGRDGGLHAPI